MTKTTRQALKEALLGHMLLTALHDPQLAGALVLSVTTLLADGIIASTQARAIETDLLSGASATEAAARGAGGGRFRSAWKHAGVLLVDRPAHLRSHGVEKHSAMIFQQDWTSPFSCSAVARCSGARLQPS